MKTMNASKFKEQCLAVLENLDPDGILITKHGKAVARVLPASSDCADLIGSMKGKIKIHGNILSTGLKWDAES
jgi:antitoxin (DNA-binding transcriptional repressor) of toxin-antitoxin stability system